MRFFEIINEMNVSNLDTIKADFSGLLTRIAKMQNFNIPKPIYDFLVKRAVKAMQNDDDGNMVVKRQIGPDSITDETPWLKTALERGDEIFEITFKDGFENRLTHVVDWLRADPESEKIIKATPEKDFLGLLAKAADEFFEESNKVKKNQSNQQSLDESGTEVVMTFRKNPQGQIRMFQESNLSENSFGVVISFWRKLTSPESLNREGTLMSHCVGSYANLVASQDVVIYSLRDMKNQPHTTVELRLNERGPPILNQVKGKGNRPPLGRYGSYIKDFLNFLAVSTSSTGSNDVLAIGLFNHDGKFGTILEIGGIILNAFSNGDTLRIVQQKDPRTAIERGYAQYGSNIYLLYVEKDGTIPFKVMTTLNTEAEITPLLLLGKQINSLTMMREEVSRYPIYAKNMIEFLNSRKMKGRTKVLEAIGVFYDEIQKVWGTRQQLTKELFKYKGITVSQILYDVLFADAHDTIFATAYYKDVFNDLKIVNQCDATKLIPELLKEFGNRIMKNQSSSKQTRDLFADYGIFWNSHKNHFYILMFPESKLFTGKSGKVCIYMNRLFFYNKEDVLVGSVFIGKKTPPYEISNKVVTQFSDASAIELYNLLTEVTATSEPLITLDYFDTRKLRDSGYYIQNNRLYALSDVEKDIKLGNGYLAQVRIAEYGDKVIDLEKSGNFIISLSVDKNNISKRINRLKDYEVNTMKYVAAIFNLEKVSMKKVDIIASDLQIKNGKYAAIDPIKDANLYNFSHGKAIPLGGKFSFKPNLSLQYFGSDDDRDGFGYVDYDYTTVCSIRFASKDKDDLVYRMPKNLDTNISRSDVIKMTAKFMQIYHDKIELYMSLQLFTPS